MCKLNEVEQIFKRYNVTVTNKKPIGKFFAKIEEKTYLKGVDINNNEFDLDIKKNFQLQSVVHTSALLYNIYDFYNDNKNRRIKELGTFEYKVYGHINYTKKVNNVKVFGFDDYFVIDNLNQTYHELKNIGLKLSARDHCIGQFIQKYLHKQILNEWHFNPQNYKNPLELHRDPYEFFESNIYINNEYSQKYGITNMINHVLNEGLFFRANRSNRQANYWFPGLNSGVPFVKKIKDVMHELTYFVHDMTHQAIPDLIYSGEVDPISRFVYICYRLMSEAITLICADVFFVDSLLKAGFKYDTMEGRKIYPLFASMKNFDFSDKQIFFGLLRASMEFCLLGDVSGFREFNPDENKLKEFIDKYEVFFIQDFRWTVHNFDDMRLKSDTYNKWWNKVNLWPNKYNKMYTVTDFIETLPNIENLINEKQHKKVCHIIFDQILKLYIEPAFNNDVKIEPFEVRYDRMFRKYIMGQSYIFFRYGFLKDNDQYINNIDKIMINDKLIDVDQGESLRSYYFGYLKELEKISLLTNDDIEIYKNVYPLFEPMYISYNKNDKMNSNCHKSFIERIIV